MVCERTEQAVKSRIPPPPQSFEERISRVRLWTVLPAVFVPMIVWNVINRHVEISAGVARWAAELLLWSSALGWWLLKAAPRPLSLRAALGRSLDLAGWGLVAWAMLANTSVRIVWWMARYCRDILQVASTSGSYTFRLPRTKVDALFAVSAAVLAPLVEELIFRGTLFRSCRVRFGPVKAALLSSALFALGHIDRDSMAIFVSALTYVLAYTRTRSLWAPIVLHAINNGRLRSQRIIADRPWASDSLRHPVRAEERRLLHRSDTHQERVGFGMRGLSETRSRVRTHSAPLSDRYR